VCGELEGGCRIKGTTGSPRTLQTAMKQTRIDDVKPHHRIFFTQFAVAVSLGGLIARLPDLQTKFGLSEGQLGTLLIALSSGVLIGLTFSVRIVERLGAKRSALVSVLGASSLFAAVPWMPLAILAAPLLFVAGNLTGMFEINSNIETDRHEAALGYRIMSRAHGLWSLGFFLSALIAAAFRQADVPIEFHMLMVVSCILLAGIFVLSRVESAPRRFDQQTGKNSLISFPTVGLMPLCLVGAAPLLAEGASVDWSAIYMRDVFDAAPFIGGLGPTVFSLAIALGRLFMDPIVDRYNPKMVVVALLGIATVGLVTVAIAAHPVIALVGFAFIGIGCSSIYPLAISAAAQRTDRPSPVNVAALSQTTFIVFFVGRHCSVLSPNISVSGCPIGSSFP
jgi:MFS family permease